MEAHKNPRNRRAGSSSAEELCPEPMLLTLQDSHRSEYIWNNSLANELLKCKRSNSNFWDPGQLPPRVQMLVDRLGFGYLSRAGNTRLDHVLITALVERWRQETHTFHLPIGEVTVTLQDVEILWGLRVDGLPVIGMEENHRPEQWQDICEELMGFRPQLSDIKGGRLKSRSFREPFSMGLPERATDAQVARYTRMFLMQLFGGILFAATNKMVPLKLLPLLRDLDVASTYSWGSAVLACLYRNLCHATLHTTQEIAGPLALLQLWAFKRFLIFKPMSGKYFDPHLTQTRVLHTYREQLDSLRETQFIWQPYSEEELMHAGYHVWRSITALIYWGVIELHRPDRVMRQFGMDQPIPEFVDTGKELHKLDRHGQRGQFGYDWELYHQTYVESWRTRDQSIANSHLIDDVSQPSIAYMMWYRRHTRLTISSTVPRELVEPYDIEEYQSPTSEDTQWTPTLLAPPGPLYQPQLPISWPSDGALTEAWVIELMQAFEWGSRFLLPSDFPSMLPEEVFEQLVLSASGILHKEPNYVRIDDGLGPMSRVVVVGDVHGQLHDVLFLLRETGCPGDDQFFVFNGDYVDRGAWGLETLLVLLAWKVLLPHRVFLLRGNHESKYCTKVYGFEKEVLVKYGDRGKHAYEKCLRCFEKLPLASVIAGRVYTAHGGLFRSIPPTKGKKKKKVNSLCLGSLEELAKANRFVSDPPLKGQNLIPGDVLWSDPSVEQGLSPNEDRGIGLLWGPDCTEEFLAKSDLKLIIRSHEGPDAREDRPGLKGMEEGYTEDHKVPSGSLITVFSAPDYPQFQATEDRYRNKGAYVVLEAPDFDIPVFHSFEAVPRPQVVAYYDFENCIDSDEELDMTAL